MAVVKLTQVINKPVDVVFQTVVDVVGATYLQAGLLRQVGVEIDHHATV